jgi:hypothetical protein
MVYLGNSPSALNCLVRDISDSGARLKFGGPVTAPDTLELHIPVKNQTLRCKVKWREVDEIGISFVSEAAAAAQPGNDELTARVERLEGEIAALKQIIKKLHRTTTGVTNAA